MGKNGEIEYGLLSNNIVAVVDFPGVIVLQYYREIFLGYTC